MAESFASEEVDDEASSLAKKLIENVILKEIRSGLQSKDIKVFENFISLLQIFIDDASNKHGTLRDLKFLGGNENGILAGLYDIKVNYKIKAVNR
jgi:hypothetical protein